MPMGRLRWMSCLILMMLAPCVAADTWKEMLGLETPQVASSYSEADQLRSCPDLYQEYMALTPSSYDYRRDFWSKPDNRIAGMVGAFFTPALAYWGYSSVNDYRKGNQQNAALARMAALERLFAEKQCFVRR
jgi:hypothetical protein